MGVVPLNFAGWIIKRMPNCRACNFGGCGPGSGTPVWGGIPGIRSEIWKSIEPALLCEKQREGIVGGLTISRRSSGVSDRKGKSLALHPIFARVLPGMVEFMENQDSTCNLPDPVGCPPVRADWDPFRIEGGHRRIGRQPTSGPGPDFLAPSRSSGLSL